MFSLVYNRSYVGTLHSDANKFCQWESGHQKDEREFGDKLSNVEHGRCRCELLPNKVEVFNQTIN